MKKATLIIWVLIFGVIALLIFQNQDFFLANQSLRVNLGVTEAYHTPELPIAILGLLFFLTGVVIAYLFSFSARFKTRRTIKKLNATLASQSTEVAELRREIDSLKGIETPADGLAPESGGSRDATQELSADRLAKGQREPSDTIAIDTNADNPSEAQKENPDEKT